MANRQAALFAQIVGFELRYQLRQRSIYVYCVIFALLGLLDLSARAASAGAELKANAPLLIAESMGPLGLLGLFIPLVIIAGVALRDVRSKMDELIRATPVAVATYLLGRFTGAFIVSCLVFCGMLVGMVIGTRMWWVDASVIGPLRLEAYLSALAIIGLPNLFLAGALFFAAASVTRSLSATFVMLLVVVVANFAAPFALSEPSLRPFASLFDPMGGQALGDVTRYWTMSERATRLIPFEGILVWNRLLWVGIGAALLAFSVARFHSRSPAARPERIPAAAPKSSAAFRVRRLPAASYGGAGVWSQLALRMRHEVRSVLRSWSFLALLGLTALTCLGGLAMLDYAQGTQVLPLTHVVAGILAKAASFISMIAIALFSATLLWRERQTGIAAIIDATPVPSFVFLVSKLAALVVMIAAILAVATAVGISFQISKGVTRIDLHFYAVKLFVLAGLPALMIGVLSVFLQTLVNHRYLGLLILLIVVVGTPIAADWLYFRDPLILFAEPHKVPLSDMNQFGHFLPAALWTLAYWSCVSVLLGVAAHALWVRGTAGPLRARLRGMHAAMTPAVTTVAIVAFAGAAATGTAIYWNTRILNTHLSATEAEQRAVAYENTYRKFEELPQPRVTEVEMEVDLWPETRGFASRGRYVLTNRSGSPIEQVHVEFNDGVVIDKVELSDSALVDAQPRFNHFVFRPAVPLAPGEARTLTFVTSRQTKGFKTQAEATSVLFNGSFVRSHELAPYIGVLQAHYLRGEKERKAHGLAPLPRIAKLDDKTRHGRGAWADDADFVRFAITLSTSADQIALAPGYVPREWTADGRRYFRYEMDTPILKFWSVLSARYAVVRDRWNDVEIAVYFHPRHNTNVSRMIDAVKESLAYYSANFGPYQHRQLRIIEFPGYTDLAQSFPNSISYSEASGFIFDNRNPDAIDYVWYLTAHEVAHQWWGHQVAGAAVQGEKFLSETLSQYSALMVMERRYGSDKMRQFLKYELDKYLLGRATSGNELPLLRVEHQSHVHYNKGSIAMYALKDAIGEATVNRVLAQLVKEHAFKTSPYTTSTDFIRLLRKQAGREHQQLITDLFERVTLWDLKVAGSDASPTADGRWRVRIDLHARKLQADGSGNEKEVPLDQAIDIGLFTADPGAGSFSARDVIRLEKQRIVGGAQSIEVIADRKPSFVGVDPYIKLIQRNTAGNVAPLGTARMAANEKGAP
jgi:ABC-2 type transport system permease protein